MRIANLDVGGWDHHTGEDVDLPPLGAQLAAALATFRSDLGPDWGRTCVLVMTEFGRTAAENGNRGTDHGHGSVMACLGGGVAGGQVVLKDGIWPGLAVHQLFEKRDLAVTTDFRDVFAEVLHRHMGAGLAELGPVLPGHAISTASMVGVLA